MIKKYYWTIAVVAAFVAGTMTTGTLVEAKQSDSLAPLNKILTLDSQVALPVMTATSSGDFIVTFCAFNSGSALDEEMRIERNGGSAFVLLGIGEANHGGGNCATVGGLAGDTIFASATEKEGLAFVTAVMQARDSATSSLTNNLP